MMTTSTERIHELEKEILVLKTQAVENRKALDKQAVEYERRLDILNHAHEEARDVLNTYVTREGYDKDQIALKNRAEVLERWYERISGGASTIDYMGRGLWAAIGGIVTAAVVFLLKGGLL